jgi:hypothetical protein
MAILAHADRLSMGNTCQLPVLTRVAYEVVTKAADVAGFRVCQAGLFFSFARFSTTRCLSPQDVHRE